MQGGLGSEILPEYWVEVVCVRETREEREGGKESEGRERERDREGKRDVVSE